MPPRKPAQPVEQTWRPKKAELSNERGFLRLRNGICEHIRSGNLTPSDFSIYVTIHLFADWRTGVCSTTAASLASNWGSWPRDDKKRSFNLGLERLREKNYIDYPEGVGEHGVYPVLLNLAEPTLGALRGWRLRLATGLRSFDNPWYEYVSPTPLVDVYGHVIADDITETKYGDRPDWRKVKLPTRGLALMDEAEEPRPCLRLADILRYAAEAKEKAMTRVDLADTSEGTTTINLDEAEDEEPEFLDPDDEFL